MILTYIDRLPTAPLLIPVTWRFSPNTAPRPRRTAG